MAYLYERINSLREAGFSSEVPKYVSDNLNKNMPLRSYQIAAFENYISYFENAHLKRKPTQTLFHMATGTGKTLIMAGLILYLYNQGYNNFLFFVNSTNIIKKTKENFLNKKSHKYLFAEEILINNERIRIKEVDNFQSTYKDDINICFTTIQGLQSMLWNVRENALTWDDFENKEIVFISDEAHHLNADTKNGNKEEKENYHSWEATIKRLFNNNNENVLLEFTATCDLANELIRSSYEDKIIYNYDLKKFRADKYSKEVKTLRSDISIMDRMLLAVLLSQYRLKVFQDNKIAIKPVLLFKSRTIPNSEQNMKEFIQKVRDLNRKEIERLATLTDNETILKMFSYYKNEGISFDELAQELKEDFGEEHCISANDNIEADTKQLLLNTLEEENNPYRAVFAVDKLNEGWDVLNLFDIVRLYETRQGGRKISPVTMSEAQLIGRGARYCPFQLNDEQDKFKRKYDDDLDNPLRTCEELYYHCQNDSRYIAELNQALAEIGLPSDDQVVREYKIKKEFKDDSLYQTGFIFMNERVVKNRNEVVGLLESVRNKIYSVSLSTGRTVVDTNLDNQIEEESNIKTHTHTVTVKDIANINYAIPFKALCKCKNLRFDILKSYYPNLKTTKEFIFDDNYMGAIGIEITSINQELTINDMNEAMLKVANEISNHISNIEETYEGTKNFKSVHINKIFKDRRRSYPKPAFGSDGDGVSQNDNNVRSEWKINLAAEDWYVFNDNYGTTEEKSFVAYFKKYVDKLKEKYDKVYLIRNERQMHLYSFTDGERFEPDYVMLLIKNNQLNNDYIQIFVEPKGPQLIETDKWKEDFLLQLESEAIPTVKFVDNNNYKIWGVHFYEYSDSERLNTFKQDFDKLINFE